MCFTFKVDVLLTCSAVWLVWKKDQSLKPRSDLMMDVLSSMFKSVSFVASSLGGLMSTEDHKLYNTKVLATYFVFMTETCTPSLPLHGPHRPADLKTSVRQRSAHCWREGLFLHHFAAITDCSHFSRPRQTSTFPLNT